MAMDGPSKGDWSSYRRSVVEKLNQHDRSIEALQHEIQLMRTEVAIIKTKIFVYTATASAGGTTVVTWLMQYLPMA